MLSEFGHIHGIRFVADFELVHSPPLGFLLCIYSSAAAVRKKLSCLVLWRFECGADGRDFRVYSSDRKALCC